MVSIPGFALASAALDMALPAACVGCACEGTPLCDRCARPLSSRLALRSGVPLGLRAEAPATIAQLEWCASFTGTVRAALHQLKYGGERRLAAPLSRAMAARWRVAGAGGDLICPVPVHAERERRRGYDQAVLLAAGMSWSLGLPWGRALSRGRNTRPQFELGRRARLTNVSGAFELSGQMDAGSLRGRWVVLVDDVATTGATLAACAEVLYSAGATAVSAMTVARER
jgi:ComF family protein